MAYRGANPEAFLKVVREEYGDDVATECAAMAVGAELDGLTDLGILTHALGKCYGPTLSELPILNSVPTNSLTLSDDEC